MAKGRKRPRGTTIGDLLRETNETPDATLLGNSVQQVQSQHQILQTQAHSYAHSSYDSQPVSQPQLHSQNISLTGPKTRKAPKKNKCRGPAKLPDEWDTDVKLQITLNEDGQLFGVKEQYNKFISALGAISRIGTYLPLDYARWSDMPQENLDTMWKEVEANTTLPPEAKKIVLQTVNGMWKDWKACVKAKYFTPYEEDPEHDFSVLPNDLENEQVDMDQLSNLVRYWKLQNVQDASNKNKGHRSQKKHYHRTGKLPFQLLRARMRHEGKPTTKLDVLIESRTCGKGLGSDPETAKLVEGINEALAKVPESERTKEFKDDLFTNVLGEDPQGRVRCMGRGITPIKPRRVFAPNIQQTDHTEKFLQLNEDLEREKLKNEQMKIELDNKLDKVKEQVKNEVWAEFKHEINHMKLSYDFLESLVEPGALQAALTRVTSFGAQLSANRFRPPQNDQQSHQVENSWITDFQVVGQVANASHFKHGPELLVNTDLQLQSHQEPQPLTKSVTPPHVQLVATRVEMNAHFDDDVVVGSLVVLFCSEIPKQVVAEGVIISMDPKEEIEKVALGPEFVKVTIKNATKPSYFLERPRKGISTVGQAIGKSVAWELGNF